MRSLFGYKACGEFFGFTLATLTAPDGSTSVAPAFRYHLTFIDEKVESSERLGTSATLVVTGALLVVNKNNLIGILITSKGIY